MSLQFVIGNSGSGKTEYVYRQVIRNSIESPDCQFIVLVPEQFTMQTQKDLVMMHDDRGIHNIDVLSFARLAWRIFEELGTRTGVVLDDMGKNLILRKIAAEYEGKLKVLKGNLRKPGYISEVKSVISEFKQYDIGIDEMEQMLGAEGESSYLYWKLRDIQIVYEGFEEYLGETYVTGEELLEIFAGEIWKSRILKESVIVLDGFTGFTPVQCTVIRELLKVCNKVIVTVTVDGREDLHRNFEDYQLFALSKKTVQLLEQLAREVRCVVEEPVVMPLYRYNEKTAEVGNETGCENKITCENGLAAARYRENAELAFLEQHIFRRSKKVWKQPCAKLHLCQGDDPEQEVRFLAGMIRRLVRTEEMYYRDIAVITGELSAYQNYVRRIFPEYGIPYFMDESRNILINSFVEYIRSLLALAEQNFSYESVFRFLRSGYGTFAEEEIDELENYILATGIRGYKRWQQPMLRLNRETNEKDLQRINHYRVRFVECVQELMFILKKKDKTVRDITEALHTFFLKEQLQQKLKTEEEQFRQAGKEALALEYAQVYRCVIELFDRFVALLGEEPISLREYSELLDAGLQEARIGIVPPGIDQVVLGDVERTRLSHIECLFFLGVNDCYIPGNGQAGGLLTDEDKEALARHGFSLSPTRKEKLFIQKFYLYQVMTKPSKQLFLSWARTDADGKSLRPSYLVQELQKLFPQLTVEKADIHKGDLTEKIAFGETVRSIFRSDNDSKLGEQLRWYMKQETWRNRLIVMLEEQQREKQRYIEAKLADRLYSADGKFGATELENYASCAYAHFLGYGLHLSEREEYVFRAMDWGNIFHRAIERYAKKLYMEKRTWQETEGELREQYLENALRESIADYGNSILYSSSRNEYLITRMQRILSRTIWALTEQLKKGEFNPSGYEVPISHGKIDRVDLCEDEEHVYVKVVDYKTGNRTLNLNDVYYGLQMQLILYLQAAMDQTRKEKRGKIVIPAGIFYYRIQDPVLETEEKELENLEKERLRTLCPTGLVNSDSEVLKKLDAKLVPSGASTVIPISLNKDGSVSGRSRASASLKDLTTLMEYTQGKKEELQVEILDGTIAQEPYRKDKETACDYCTYAKICNFEGVKSGKGYRDLKQMEREEILRKMREEDADGSEVDQ